MTEMVRKEDVLRMFREAFQKGDACDPQLIPNLMTSLTHFTPTFDFEPTLEQKLKAQGDVEDALIKFGIKPSRG